MEDCPWVGVLPSPPWRLLGLETCGWLSLHLQKYNLSLPYVVGGHRLQCPEVRFLPSPPLTTRLLSFFVRKDTTSPWASSSQHYTPLESTPFPPRTKGVY